MACSDYWLAEPVSKDQGVNILSASPGSAVKIFEDINI
jgi:hypothetical protein